MKQVAEKIAGGGSADAQIEAARTLMIGGGASMVYHFMGDDDIARIMKHPMVSFASDAGVIQPGSGVPHPRGYGNAVRVLGEYVRERKTISLEEAVRKMTSLPAAHFGFAGRGLIKEGAAADLVLFDPATVKDEADLCGAARVPLGDAARAGQWRVRGEGRQDHRCAARPDSAARQVIFV
jgi:N-acyl-D-amino-acid deacylase